jgi:hypothetical protein
MQTGFDESVWDVVGLTAYQPLTLPDWLRERLDGYYFPADRPADRDLVERYIAGDGCRQWVGRWGDAVIGGENVFIFEYTHDPFFGFFDPAMLAEGFECGLVFVEPSRFDIGATLYFTEERQYAKRNRSPLKESPSPRQS